MRLTLKGIKRRGKDQCIKFWLMRDMPVRIWSREHRAYWRPGRSGYSVHKEAAGIYDLDDAYKSTRHCGSEKLIEYHTLDEAQP